jgi:hypothetical protein
MKPVKIPAFDGMNNRFPDFANRTDKEHFLRAAVNVDLTQVGTIRRRKGSAQVIPGDDCHSLFTTPGAAYYVDYKSLIYIDTDTMATDEVLDDLTFGRRRSYATLPSGPIVASDGLDFYKLVGAVATPFTVPLPNQPLVTTVATGSLPAGTYQVVCTHVNAEGVEGGTTVPVAVEVAAGGRVLFTVPSLAGYETRVYMTSDNGDQFFHVPGLAAGDSADVSVLPPFGRRCQTLLLAPLPPGNIVRINNGRLFTASGSVLYYSEPFAEGLYNPLKGFISFPADITMVEPCGDGLYVSADQTYWFGGDIATAEMTPVLPYKALPYAATGVNNNTSIWWMSERGIVMGDENGKVQNVQEKDVVVKRGTSGAALFREQDGVRQLIATVFGENPGQSVAAASTWMEAEIVRKGVTL